MQIFLCKKCGGEIVCAETPTLLDPNVSVVQLRCLGQCQEVSDVMLVDARMREFREAQLKILAYGPEYEVLCWIVSHAMARYSDVLSEGLKPEGWLESQKAEMACWGDSDGMRQLAAHVMEAIAHEDTLEPWLQKAMLIDEVMDASTESLQ